MFYMMYLRLCIFFIANPFLPNLRKPLNGKTPFPSKIPSFSFLPLVRIRPFPRIISRREGSSPSRTAPCEISVKNSSHERPAGVQ